MPEAVDLERAAAALRAQWYALRAWVHGLVVDDAPRLAVLPSVLAGWSVADLVAHVGRSMDALTAVTPAPDGTVPLSLGRYVGGYAAGAERIAEITRTLAAEIAGDPVGRLDAMAQSAFDRLDALGGDRVVIARRGPIRLSDMVVSRVVELVVHADDLTRSVPWRDPAPLDDDALRLVGHALLGVLVERTGGPAPTLTDPLAWVRPACGRTPVDLAALAAAVHPSPGGPGLSDVAAALPLL